MKKIIAIDKSLEFPTMIGEVSAISLEKNINFIDEENIEGELFVNGKYKLTEASRLEEDFSYKIPVEIALTDKLDIEKSKIEITDFFYEIEEDNLLCHIELTIEGEIIEDNNRECDGDVTEKEIEIPVLEKEELHEEIKEEIIEESRDEEEIDDDKEEIEEDKEVTDSLFINLSEENETYGTFVVYIVRQNESINTIVEKYNTSIEEIEKYNDISNINIGTKLIIPVTNE